MPHRPELRRILVYTHNSIGLGHAVRTMAVIDGMRAAMPEAEFLVLSGGSAPQIFLSEFVETIKLPGLRHDLNAAGQPFLPRYLPSLSRDEVLAWRRQLIADSLAAFRPHVVMIEHSLAGLMGEAAPLLAGSRALIHGGHVLVHLSRGIYRENPMLLAPAGEYVGLPSPITVTGLYDALYVLEDRTAVDVNREFFGNDPALEERIHYLGRVTAKNLEELQSGETLAAALRLQPPLVLVSLGRHGRVCELHAQLFNALAALKRLGRYEAGEVLVVLDPYLSREETAQLKAAPHALPVRRLPFAPGLAEVMAASDLVVSRAGYNTCNELLVTGRPALVIPETHPSREQERRAQGLPREQVRVMTEEQCLAAPLEETLSELLARPVAAGRHRFDRFCIGRRIVEDLRRIATAS